eukprot:1838701-Rhodomonas_salina.1
MERESGERSRVRHRRICTWPRGKMRHEVSDTRLCISVAALHSRLSASQLGLSSGGFRLYLILLQTFRARSGRLGRGGRFGRAEGGSRRYRITAYIRGAATSRPPAQIAKLSEDGGETQAGSTRRQPKWTGVWWAGFPFVFCHGHSSLLVVTTMSLASRSMVARQRDQTHKPGPKLAVSPTEKQKSTLPKMHSVILTTHQQ